MALSLAQMVRDYAEIDLTRMGVDSRITFTRSSTRTYFDAAGVMQTAPINTWPLEYDPATGQCLGRSVWEQRTNLLTYSGIDTGISGLSRANVADTAISWLGQFSKGIAFGNNTVTRYGYRTNFQNQINVTYVMSAIARADDAGALVHGGNTTGYDCALVLAGQIGSAAITAALGGGLYRISAARSHSAANNAHGVIKYTGNTGRGFSVTGYQLEQALFAGPYIPTTSSAVTRGADAAVVGSLRTMGYQQDRGTLVVTAKSPPSVATARTLVSLNDGTANECIRLHMQVGGALRAQVIDGGVTVADLALGTLTANQDVRAALAFSANDIRGCLNGGSIQADGVATLPTVTRLQIGDDVTASHWCAPIKRVRYYPRHAGNDVQQLTA